MGQQDHRPDLGGKEADDNRLMTEMEHGRSVVVNNPGIYRNVCAELDIDALAVNTLLQSHAIHDLEGTAGAVAFDSDPQANLQVLKTFLSIFSAKTLTRMNL